MGKDFAHEINIIQSLIPAHTTSTPSPTVVDTKGYGSTMFIVNIGAIGTSATLACHFHEGATSSPTGDVAAADLDIYNWTTGAAVASATLTCDDGSDNSIFTVQYLGDYRYVVPVPVIGTEHYDMSITTVQSFERRPAR